ncbi:hypothetical protein [Mesorhizobium sp.]|uniref:hypothetical protein n=1 Tax=Mesorhizobium sp. TaxID=1871066 RepID=UPI000FE722B0|nr:hypothetical protein [Mesorhizobium sp.]RWA81305.1 MAG: hypothetical protein EOQ30_19200 [Mesorhizobium sp.]
MTRKPVHRPSFELQAWYSSDQAKRSFGAICQSVNREGEKIGLLGSRDRPYLFLQDIDDADLADDDIEITIEEARADWPAVTYAAMLLGSRFQIHGKKRPRALLFRNENEPHAGLKYRKPQTPHMAVIATKLEEILKEIQKLGRVRLGEKREMSSLVTRFETAAELIERRFRDVWRTSQGLPIAFGGSPQIAQRGSH